MLECESWGKFALCSCSRLKMWSGHETIFEISEILSRSCEIKSGWGLGTRLPLPSILMYPRPSDWGKIKPACFLWCQGSWKTCYLCAFTTSCLPIHEQLVYPYVYNLFTHTCSTCLPIHVRLVMIHVCLAWFPGVGYRSLPSNLRLSTWLHSQIQQDIASVYASIVSNLHMSFMQWEGAKHLMINLVTMQVIIQRMNRWRLHYCSRFLITVME